MESLLWLLVHQVQENHLLLLIVFAEGQRRFMESMSAYARQFVEQMSKPNVDSMEGMQLTVAIEKRVTRGSRKSTVGSQKLLNT